MKKHSHYKTRIAIEYAFSAGWHTDFGQVRNPQGEVITQHVDRARRTHYRWFSVYVPRFKCAIRIRTHRFVAFALYGSRVFRKGLHVRHLDGNSENNSAFNIALGTAKDNAKDKLKRGDLFPPDLCQAEGPWNNIEVGRHGITQV